MNGARITELLDRLPVRVIALALTALVAAVFATTAEWGPDQNVDAIAAALPAWSVAETGSLVLPEFASANPWVADGAIGLVSNRPPGVWLLAVPVYFLARPFTSGFTFWPATLTAVLTTASAVGVMFLVLARLVDRRLALAAALVFAFGTANWPISGAQLWPHGTVQLLLTAGMLSLASRRQTLAGTTAAIMILARPPTAVISAVQAIYLAWVEKTWRTVLKLGIAPLIGLFALLLYNREVFGAWSISGGYPESVAGNLLEMGAGQWLVNSVAMFLDPYNGLFVWSPIILILLPGISAAWRTSPQWVRSSALAGLVYVLVHARLNRVSGGLPFDYRYQLPLVALAAPLMSLASVEVRRRPLLQRLIVPIICLSVGLQALNAVFLDCTPGGSGVPTEVSCSFF